MLTPKPLPGPPMLPIPVKTDPGNLTQAAQNVAKVLRQDARTHLGRMFGR